MGQGAGALTRPRWASFDAVAALARRRERPAEAVPAVGRHRLERSTAGPGAGELRDGPRMAPDRRSLPMPRLEAPALAGHPSVRDP